MATLNLDPSQLESYALESGATLRRANGEVFNSAGRKGVFRLPEHASAKPEPPATDNSSLVGALVEAIARIPQPPAPVINVLPAPVVSSEKKAVRWKFSFSRDANGLTREIVANSTSEEKDAVSWKFSFVRDSKGATQEIVAHPVSNI